MKTSGAVTKDWIGVDRHGLAALLERRGVGWAIYELVQNALDTEATAGIESSTSGASRSAVISSRTSSAT